MRLGGNNLSSTAQILSGVITCEQDVRQASKASLIIAAEKHMQCIGRESNVGTTARAATPTTRSLGLPGVDWWQEYVIAHPGHAGRREPSKQKLLKILKIP